MSTNLPYIFIKEPVLLMVYCFVGVTCFSCNIQVIDNKKRTILIVPLSDYTVPDLSIFNNFSLSVPVIVLFLIYFKLFVFGVFLG